jgi:hypothetical protein
VQPQQAVHVSCNIFVGSEYFQDILEVWFSDLYDYWRKWLFLVLVTLEDKVVLKI